jgi:hypothetical protein
MVRGVDGILMSAAWKKIIAILHKHGFGVRKNINGDIITGSNYKVKYVLY